jgi:hypothetical protein
MTWVAVGMGLASMAYGEFSNRRAKKEAEKGQKEDQKYLDTQLEQQKQLTDMFGRPLVQQGMQNMNSAQGILQQMASGDRSLTQQAMAPQINQMTDMMRGGVQAQRGLMPRGGMSASQAGGMNQQLQGNINNMLFGARTNAIGQLAQLGGNQASLGLGAMGQGAGLTNNMLQYGLNARNQMFNQGMAAGAGAMGQADYLTRMGMMAYNNYQNRQTAPSPYTVNQQSQFKPGGDLGTWGQGSTLGFGRGVGSTYSNSSNIYGKSS